ncbi:hypothetical protein V6C27_07935 [Peptococcaceae bacterium 1198_IL3148]
MSKNKIDYQKLYQLTADVTPLSGDCGQLCGGICCRSDSDNSLGMYLFPGEEVMFSQREDWLQWEQRDPREDNFPESWQAPVNFVSCTKPCPREKRPLSCRFFPLAPHLLKDNTLLLIHETLALPYTCPLIEDNMALRPDFIEVVAQCWQELLKSPDIRDLVEMDSRERERDGLLPTVLWWGD